MDEIIISLRTAIEATKNQPAMNFLWWGIPDAPSLTLVAAKAKIGKTMFCENLALALVDDECNEFLGFDIMTKNKVVIISFEEHFINRSQRQNKQVSAYINITGTKTPIEDRIFVLNENYSQFLADDSERYKLSQILHATKPEVLIIDSLGRLGVGQIENSDHSQMIMLYLRTLAFELGLPVIVLHHTVKSKKRDTVELSSMAGSRVIAQEADAIFTIIEGNNTGDRIIKPLAFRYTAAEDNGPTFKITDDCLLALVESTSFNEGRTSKLSKIKILENYFTSNCTATTAQLEKYVSDNDLMSRSTLFEVIKKVPVENLGNGIYRYKLCNTQTLESPIVAEGSLNKEDSIYSLTNELTEE